MSLSLATVLSAATCPDKIKAYSGGYSSVAKQLKEDQRNYDSSGLKNVFYSSFTRTTCDIECKIIAAGKDSDTWSDKKYASCYDTCTQGAQDAYSGTKPKMKLCEEEKK